MLVWGCFSLGRRGGCVCKLRIVIIVVPSHLFHINFGINQKQKERFFLEKMETRLYIICSLIKPGTVNFTRQT